MSALQLVVGKSYITRDGFATTIIANDDDVFFPFVANNNICYTRSGKSALGIKPSRYDLVAELHTAHDALISAESTELSYNWITHLHEHGCGQYQYDLHLFTCVEAYVLKHTAQKQAAPSLLNCAQRSAAPWKHSQQYVDAINAAKKALTQAAPSLLNCAQRSAAPWKHSQQYVDAINAAKKALTQAARNLTTCCHKTVITRCDGCPHAHKEVQS